MSHDHLVQMAYYVARFASVPNSHAHTVDLWKVYHSHYGAWSAWSEASGVGDGWREGEWVRQVFSPLRHLFSSLHICPTLFSLFVSVFRLRLIVWTDNPQAPACFLIKLNNIYGRHYLLKAKRVGQIHRCVRPCYYLDETSTHKGKGDLKKKNMMIKIEFSFGPYDRSPFKYCYPGMYWLQGDCLRAPDIPLDLFPQENNYLVTWLWLWPVLSLWRVMWLWRVLWLWQVLWLWRWQSPSSSFPSSFFCFFGLFYNNWSRQYSTSLTSRRVNHA